MREEYKGIVLYLHVPWCISVDKGNEMPNLSQKRFNPKASLKFRNGSSWLCLKNFRVTY